MIRNDTKTYFSLYLHISLTVFIFIYKQNSETIFSHSIFNNINLTPQSYLVEGCPTYRPDGSTDLLVCRVFYYFRLPDCHHTVLSNGFIWFADSHVFKWVLILRPVAGTATSLLPFGGGKTLEISATLRKILLYTSLPPPMQHTVKFLRVRQAKFFSP